MLRWCVDRLTRSSPRVHWDSEAHFREIIPKPTFSETFRRRLKVIFGLKDRREDEIVTYPMEDEIVTPLTPMIVQLKERSETVQGYPINSTVLSVPIFTHDLEHIDRGQFREPMRQAQLEVPVISVANGATATCIAYEVDECASGYLSDSHNPEASLKGSTCLVFLEYSKAALRIALAPFELDVSNIEVERHTEFPEYGANSPLRDAQYWQEVKNCIDEVIKPPTPDPITKVVLLGDSATDPLFVRAVQQVFESFPLVKPGDFIKDAEEHLYIAAQGVAALAREGMKHDWDACIPNPSCPQADDGEGNKHRWHQELKPSYVQIVR